MHIVRAGAEELESLDMVGCALGVCFHAWGIWPTSGLEHKMTGEFSVTSFCSMA